ncbi:MAG TPA: prepilin-type N-terminal cleavage/methylation domain-containing protein [Opitutaceae bacterium]|nr:prepilin-type N-terminal cleavage/methylation domain-containing protein [Opitutaceae bacterium]
MTLSARRIDRAARARLGPGLAAARARRGAGGFTLVEVLMATALSALVLAGVLSTFVFIVGTGQRAADYSSTEAEVRRGLEQFGRDARVAVDIRWHGPQRLTFILPSGDQPEVTYAYDAEPGSATSGCLYREPAATGGAAGRQVLVRNIAPDFRFARFKIGPVYGGEPAAAANDLETKQIQVVLRAVSARIGGGAAATQAATSPRYVLRNKKVSN